MSLWKKFCNTDIIVKIIILILLFIIAVATITVITRYKNASIETQSNDVNILDNNNIESDNTIIENNIAEDNLGADNNATMEETSKDNNNQTISKSESASKSITNLSKSNEKNTDTKKETNTKSNTTNNEKTEQHENSNSEKSIQDTESKIHINLEKYDRYDRLSNGYRCFSRNSTEIAKLKTLINQAIQEFGYTNVQIQEDKSIVSDRYFTANKVNVENAVYNSDGFTIYYYAESEYHVDLNGAESLFQVRSYIKVK